MVTRVVLAYNLAYIKPRPRHAVGGALSDNGVCQSVCLSPSSQPAVSVRATYATRAKLPLAT